MRPSSSTAMVQCRESRSLRIGRLARWPARSSKPRAAFYCYAHPAPEGFAHGTLSPQQARWDGELGEYILDWDVVRSSADPRGAALEFARSGFRHACVVCDWDPALLESAEGAPPPV